MTLVKKSGCKINLLLNILGKRDDGFHELETVMQPVALHDELAFSIGGPDIVLTSNRPDLPCDRTNLIVRAADLFRITTKVSEGVGIHLEKRIPMEAGLGGGSSNAATTLLGLNEIFGKPLGPENLQGLAEKLGSDVPYFLQNQPGLATGRGERIQPLEPFAAFKNVFLVLIHPGFGISTAWSYQALADFPEALNGRRGRAMELIEALSSNIPCWGEKLYNSLEYPAFKKYPVLKLYVEEFKEHGAVCALMSGSGSTVYACFDSRTKAEHGLEAFHSKFGRSCWTSILPIQDAE